ncbi:MAG: RNA 2',3'-cyclic phosphodiesterase [Campylobacterales bacterium]|nr:RNA 2',3'-cyclic phosphodiesterase [Campylobacterales bacterium]
MRLFIASPIILDDYAAIQKDFEGIIEGKWVEEENLHLTWVFLGNIMDETPVIEKMQNITHLSEEVAIAELGYFGRPPKVFFAKAQAKMLYDKAREFKAAGFNLYRFKPHITLCRIKAIHDYKAYKETLKTYRDKTLGKIRPQISLYESSLSEKGPLYKRRFEIE